LILARETSARQVVDGVEIEFDHGALIFLQARGYQKEAKLWLTQTNQPWRDTLERAKYPCRADGPGDCPFPVREGEPKAAKREQLRGAFATVFVGVRCLRLCGVGAVSSLY
jgi:hypothetical protein